MAMALLAALIAAVYSGDGYIQRGGPSLFDFDDTHTAYIDLDGNERDLHLFRFNATYPAAYDTIIAQTDEAPIVVDLYGHPGSETSRILSQLKLVETIGTHHDIWIFQSGKNDAAIFGGNPSFMEANYRNYLNQAIDYAQNLGVLIIVQEIEPISVDVVAARSDQNYAETLQNLIIQLNSASAEICETRAIPYVETFDEFLPHYTTDADSWVRNPANGGGNDGTHPSAIGTGELAGRWWGEIRNHIGGFDPVRVAVFGDSISASVPLEPIQKRPASWLAFRASTDTIPVELSQFQLE